jgi:hypothetical protein
MDRRYFLAATAAAGVCGSSGIAGLSPSVAFGSFQAPFSPPAGFRRLGGQLELPEKCVPADARRTLSAERTRFGNLGEFKTVVDNPSLPMGPFAPGPVRKRYTVVFVAGNPFMEIDGLRYSEREEWAESARTTYGKNVFVYNDVLSVGDVAKRLEHFPPGAVRTLIFGGHSGPSGGVYMGIERPLPPRFGQARYSYYEPNGCESINAINLENRPTELATIVKSLSDDASVQFQTCCVGDDLNRLARLARVLKSAVIASTDRVQEWGVTETGVWYRADKPK